MNTTIRQTASMLARHEADALDAAALLHTGRTALKPLLSFFRRHRQCVRYAVRQHLHSDRAAARFASEHCQAAVFAIREALRLGTELESVAGNWRREGPGEFAGRIRNQA